MRIIPGAVLIALLCVAGARADVTPAPLPAGPEGELITYGKQIIEQTAQHAGAYQITAGMSCEACHVDAGAKPHGGSFVGIYAKFPQWNARAQRFITLQDRLAECFLYSMNGRPPAFDSREMIALTAYIAYLSRGTVVGVGAPDQGLVPVTAPAPANVARGQATYDAKCAACHAADGSGGGNFPPLWGPKSFNAGAGMHRPETMAAFVRYNMPFGSPPNTLTAQETVDVTAFVLSHSRPAFDANQPIAFPPQPASFF
ncbi:MAG: c-type cytochrome [Candidatus Lustribacter sp.]|jgi:thiosulfate dehydrogenase